MPPYKTMIYPPASPLAQREYLGVFGNSDLQLRLSQSGCSVFRYPAERQDGNEEQSWFGDSERHCRDVVTQQSALQARLSYRSRASDNARN